MGKIAVALKGELNSFSKIMVAKIAVGKNRKIKYSLDIKPVGKISVSKITVG